MANKKYVYVSVINEAEIHFGPYYLYVLSYLFIIKYNFVMPFKFYYEIFKFDYLVF